MSYDLTVFPADRVTSLAAALRTYQTLLDADDEGEPSPQLRDFTAELNERYGGDDDQAFLSVPVTANAHGALVATWWPSQLRNLYAVLELTKDRGLAVLDVQVPMLYDPRGHLDLRVRLGDGTDVPYLSPSLLDNLLPLPDPEAPWLTLIREEEVYAQTRRFDDGTYELEHRAGSADRHFQARVPDVRLAYAALWSWATDDPAWRYTVRWQRIHV